MEDLAQNEEELGVQAIRCGQLLWNLYAPASTFDPAVAAGAVARSTSRVRSSLLDRLATLDAHGLDQRLRRMLLLEELLALEAVAPPEASAGLPVRPFNGVLLARFVDQVNTFHADHLSDSTIERLIFEATQAAVGSSDHLAARLDNLSLSLASFQRRLHDAFGQELIDLCQPVLAASVLFRIGFTCLRAGLASRARNNTYSQWEIYRFPGPSVEPRELSSHVSARIRLAILSVRVATSRYLTSRDADLASHLTDDFFGSWAASEERRKNEEMAAAAEYKTKDEPDEARELQELFEIATEEDPLPSKPDAEDAHLLPDAFLGIWLNKPQYRIAQHLSALLDRSLASETSFATATTAADQETLVHQVSLLGCQHEESAPRRNFYHDPTDPVHFTGIVELIGRLQSRVRTIAEEWPEQMMLPLILETADAILTQPVTITPARLLARIELLLSPIDDWQSVSSAELSLAAFKQELILIIIEFRKAELAGWRDLLVTELASFQARGKAFWWHLYELLPAFAAGTTLQAKEAEPLALLLNFLDNCPIGQFQVRMDLLRAFAAYADRQLDVSTTRTLESVVACYARHSAGVADEVKSQTDLVSLRPRCCNFLICA
jgi:midasin